MKKEKKKKKNQNQNWGQQRNKIKTKKNTGTTHKRQDQIEQKKTHNFFEIFCFLHFHYSIYNKPEL